MFDRIVNGINSIKESLGNLATDITSGITSAFQSVGDYILGGIRDIFVPSEDYVTDRWNAIRERFSFADSITETADIILTFFKETAFNEPPTIKVDFGYAESKYNWGGETFCLDMSWYARYKPIVDPFLSAWIWLVFIWRVFNNLPNIINGVAGNFEMAQTMNENSAYVKYRLNNIGSEKGKEYRQTKFFNRMRGGK